MFLSIPILILLAVVILAGGVGLCLLCYDRGWHDCYTTLEKLYKAMRK